MKLKLLLAIFILSSGILNAQDTIKTLIITEARMTHPMENYAELTNMGDEPIQLSEFEFGLIRPWNNEPYTPENETRAFMLPDRILQPGESFVIASVYDLNPKMFKAGSNDYKEKITKDEIWDIADVKLHTDEALYGEPGDSITEPHYWTMFTYQGRGCWYVRHHVSETDSVVIDQVGGVFDEENGLNNTEGFYDVAGVTGATGNSVLVRRYSVKSGNLDFANARGVGLDDSEWMPVPIQGGFAYDNQNLGHWRAVPWTLGNHVNYQLDGNTLESDVIDVDFENKTLSVPWGVRSNDDIMNYFEKKHGIAWAYHFSPEYEDSLYMSARTGDKLTIYVCGNDLDVATFDIVVSDPAVSANIVIPKYNVDPEGEWRTTITQGQVDWPRVTRHESGQDTITGAQFGLPFATRIDSLLDRLEKAPNASWEFIWVDGVERVDLKDGDILKVTAEDGSEKEYYIQVKNYQPSDNALLSSITWPDIPDFYRGVFGWKEDTIPGFSPTTHSYRIEVPLEYEGVPALVAKSENLNANIDAKRATTLDGSRDQRIVEFTVQAEDDTTFRFYNVEFYKEQRMEDIQPYSAEPFFSEFVFQFRWGPTSFLEICNPGNQVLDLSNYMIVGVSVADPAVAITTASEADSWGMRYSRYVPGYKWVSKADWEVNPSMLVRDISVNPLVMPGDVFVLGSKAPWHNMGNAVNEIDIDFVNNPWGEFIHPFGQTVTRRWANHNFYMFKILNDSIKLGLKPAIELQDFELIEVFGTGNGSMPELNLPFDQTSTTIRKPEYTTPEKLFNKSFENEEWEHKPFLSYWIPNGGGILAVVGDLGTHFFKEPTMYKSTITSIVYKVTKGYSINESIRGIVTGTSVSEFYNNIIKANENQTFTVKSAADGAELALDANLTLNDTLVVLSADSTNTTKYILEVTDEGLNSDAILTSDLYEIITEDEPKSATDDYIGSGSISGFEYGTALKTIIANVNLPMGANLSVIDNEGLNVPLKMLSFDTAYVDVTVNHNTYFEVIAEDGITTIIYQLQPEASENTAFVTSNVYGVSQRNLLIEFIPRGTTVKTFIANVIPSLGATVQLIDKLGLERKNGEIKQDDRLVVTSPNGEVQTVYYFSMLRTEYIQSTTYLAYVTSNVYTVDQLYNTINGATAQTSLNEFYSRITPAFGASAVVVDENGVEKTSGDLDDGDMLKVSSADAKVIVMYDLQLDLTSAQLTDNKQFNLYPNPTTGVINVSGVKSGERIEVVNLIGSTIQQIEVTRSIETVRLDEQPSGIYFIVISNDAQRLANYKVVKQ